MNKKGLLIVPLLFALLICAAGCVANKAISASAVADNLAVEKAQNEMLLLNVLRGKDQRPMYVTGIQKITGSVKAEASLGATAPFGSVGAGPAAAAHYVASPTATYSWAPTFEDIVFDTSEFMHGFLAPIDSNIFAYYWNLGFYEEVLFHLMVRKVQVTVMPKRCTERTEYNVDEYIFTNNHEQGDTEPLELERFAEWINFFFESGKPHFVEGPAEPLGPPLKKEQVQPALVAGLQAGLTLAPAGAGFQFQRLGPPPTVLELSGDLQAIYCKTVKMAIESGKMTVESGVMADVCGKLATKNGKKADECLKMPDECGPETYQHKEICSTGGDVMPLKTSAGNFRTSGDLTNKDEQKAQMTITFFLRSPEAILYYLGELARLEDEQDKALFLCIGNRFEPLFAVRRSGGCKDSSVAVTNADGVAYAIPTEKYKEPCNGQYEFREFSCNPGRSMEALTIVSQIIALQQSAKNLPASSVFRVVGQ